jgi:hypothetical protein
MSEGDVPEIQPYTYHALSEGEFRLLSLQPGPFESPISILLEHRILSESLSIYEALSYAWGTSPERKTIGCGDSKLHITVNLFDALRRLRSTTTTRVLWIDAICINQEDLDERSSQVPLMRFIYPRASQVIAWVGEEDDTSQLAMSTFEEWASLYTEDIHSKVHIRQEFQSRFGLRHNYESAVAAISSFLRRPWFSRCWTLQEISLCQDATILCGEVEMPWNTLNIAFLVAAKANLDPSLSEDDPQIFPRCAQLMICNNWEMQTEGAPTLSLPVVLSLSYQFAASDPRDKIYSLLSLADINDLSLYVPRYDIPVCDVYTLTTIATLKDTNELYMLATTERESADPELPSWVTDWRQPPKTITICDNEIYNVNHNQRPSLYRLKSTLPLEIQLDGACVDQLSRTYSLTGLLEDLSVGERRWDFTVPLSSFSGHINLGDDYPITGEDMLMALFRTLNVDQGFHSNRNDLGFKHLFFPWHYPGVLKPVLSRTNKREATKWHTIPKFFRRLVSFVPQRIRHAKERASYNVAVRNAYRNLPLSSTRLAVNIPLSTLLRYLPLGKSYHKDENILHNISNEAARYITTMIKNRSFFVTIRGYIGIGPDTMEPGDMVCTLFGSTVPFILRPVEGSEKFRLIGESYVHGVMDGELWKETDDGMVEPAAEGLELRSFTLI